MSEKNINKLIVGDKIYFDLSSDSVTPETLGAGVTAHDKSGAQITGTAEFGGTPSWESVENKPFESLSDQFSVDDKGVLHPVPDSTLGITGASVGQAAVVKAVDTDGKPAEWEAADLPVIFTVHAKKSRLDDTVTFSESYEEILEAYNSGKKVEAIVTDYRGANLLDYSTLPLVSAGKVDMMGEEYISLYFLGIGTSRGDPAIAEITVRTDVDSATLTIQDIIAVPAPTVSSSRTKYTLVYQSFGGWRTEEYIPLPAVTAADNGKILKVVDGEWTAVEA